MLPPIGVPPPEAAGGGLSPSERAVLDKASSLTPGAVAEEETDESLYAAIESLEAKIRNSTPPPSGEPPSPEPPSPEPPTPEPPGEFRWLGGSFVVAEGFPPLRPYGEGRGSPRGVEATPGSETESGSDDPGPELLSPPKASARDASKRRRAALGDLLKHLQSLAAAAEDEHRRRRRLAKVRVPTSILALEERVEALRRIRVASGEALAALRSSGDLGAPGGRAAAHADVLEAAIAVARSDDLVLDGPVVKALRTDVDAHVRLVRRALRRADKRASEARAAERHARDPPTEEPPLQRGSGFSEIRKFKPRPPPAFHGPGDLARDREITDVLVVRKRDGLAVKRTRPAYVVHKEQQPPWAGAAEISRHCRYQPSAEDISSLALYVW